MHALQLSESKMKSMESDLQEKNVELKSLRSQLQNRNVSPKKFFKKVQYFRLFLYLLFEIYHRGLLQRLYKLPVDF